MLDNSTVSMSEAIIVSFQEMWSSVIDFIPMLAAALVILIVGWIIGLVIGKVVQQIMRTLKVDEALRKAGLEDVLQKGGIRLDSGHFVGSLVKWFIIVVFLVAALDTLKLTQVTEFLKDVVLYLPQVIVAALVLLVAVIVADVMQRVVSASAKAVRLRAANFLGSVTKWSILVFAVLVALDQLGIADHFVQMIFTGIIIALSLALGLSFGLGGQESASRFIDRLREEISEKK
jgi:hypothetical protein